MNDEFFYTLLADAVLTMHVGVVVFVVGGLVFIVVGNPLGWGWVNGWWFRLAHLAAIATVVAESWLGLMCPLTSLEMWLRGQGGAPIHADGFISHWLQTLLYIDAPAWVFLLAYTLFGAAVVAVWWVFPPRRRGSPGTASSTTARLSARARTRHNARH